MNANVDPPFDALDAPLRGLQMVEASAGTGKTHTLCALVLRLVLERGLQVRQILVVTFTNAACAELRSRIRARLADARGRLRDGTEGGDEFLGALVSRAPCGRSELASRLDLALASFDEASIFTIHGFCQRALADSAFGAGLPMQLQQIEDDDEQLLRVVHDFWRARLAGDSLDPGLARHLLARGTTPQTLAEHLRRRLNKPLARLRWPDDDAPAADLAAWRAVHAKARASWSDEHARIVDIVTGARPRLPRNVYGEKPLQAAFESWDRLASAEDPLRAPADLEKVDLLAAHRLQAKRGEAPVPPHAFFELAGQWVDACAQCETAWERQRLGLLRELLEQGPPALRRLKIEQRVIGFDDMLANLHSRLSGDAGEALAQALRGRFPAALIDEFQDTDPQQFEIFARLYAGGDAPAFLVGDPKQAIYSFRNADLHTYLRARRIAVRGGTLVHNQRSTRELIDALNALFERNPRAFVIDGLHYHRVDFGTKRRAPLNDASGGTGAGLQLWRLPTQPDGAPLHKSAALRAAADACADEIVRLLAAARAGRLHIDARRVGAGDIAVLVRTHRHGAWVRRALAARGVGSIELAQQSVFATADAQQLLQLLEAIAEPARETALRAALATEAMGWSALDIDALGGNALTLAAIAVRFDGYHRTWQRHGVARMLRQWMTGEGVAARLLARADGERRMTNLAHLGERVHAAEHEHPSPPALLRWLRTQCAAPQTGDDSLLRLESDRDLVQVVTIHRSKGLEYPIVFCPMLFDGHPGRTNDPPDGLEVHDEDDQVSIDYRLLDEAGRKALVERRKLERRAESLRGVYVALTRAVHRCTLVVGTYANGNGSTKESLHGPLNWLAAGAEIAPESWADTVLKPETVEAQWQALVAAAGGAIALDPLPAPSGAVVASDLPEPHRLAALPPPTSIAPAWSIASYSSLVHGAAHDAAARDHDLRSPSAPRSGSAASTASAADDIVHFPRGAAAGECLHALLEMIDFDAAAGWPSAIERVLARHAAALPADETTPLRARMLERMLDDVLRTELPGGIVLARLPRRRRLTEMEFHLPARGLRASALAALLRNQGYAPGPIGAGGLAGYLRGFVDLVCEHEGRYYVIDWKSNHLGNTADDYVPAALRRTMDAQGYHVQYLLYALAVHRHLELRLDGYDYEKHFGGVRYLFLRGVRPHWHDAEGAPCGVYAHRPERAVIDALSRLFAREDLRR